MDTSSIGPFLGGEPWADRCLGPSHLSSHVIPNLKSDMDGTPSQEIDDEGVVPVKEWGELYGFPEEAIISRIQSGILDGFEHDSEWYVRKSSASVQNDQNEDSSARDSPGQTINLEGREQEGYFEKIPLWEIEWSIYVFFGAGMLFLPFIDFEANTVTASRWMCFAGGLGFVSLVAYNLKADKTYWPSEYKRENHPFLYWLSVFVNGLGAFAMFLFFLLAPFM